ncbi:MAG: TetR/AcrR family transcriptional regulator [Anaerolineales bacterium]|nr:TetR/AcrR family transcriptional regulator [Anaerolineales bacterium]
MPAPKIDRRVLRTRAALRQALMELIREKGYEALTVEEITQRADLGRATFYLHYKDKDDLLLEEFSLLAQERVNALSEIPFSDWLPDGEDQPIDENNEPIQPFLMVFQHVSDNAELYRILLKSQSSNQIANRIREILFQSINQFVQTKSERDPIPIRFKVPVDLLAAYFNGALVSSIDWWLENMQQVSVKEMTGMFQCMFFPGARKIMGLPGQPAL